MHDCGKNGDVELKIVEHIAVLGVNPNSQWTKELNIVSWNGSEPKYDLRDWSPDKQKLSKGITLTKEQMEVLIEAYQKHSQK